MYNHSYIFQSALGRRRHPSDSDSEISHKPVATKRVCLHHFNDRFCDLNIIWPFVFTT